MIKIHIKFSDAEDRDHFCDAYGFVAPGSSRYLEIDVPLNDLHEIVESLMYTYSVKVTINAAAE